jgi:hypothetical protein
LGGPADFSSFIPLVLLSAGLRHLMTASELQHFYYGMMMGLQFAGMAWLTEAIFPGRRLAAFGAAAFYCFNVSMFQTLPFPMFMFFLAYTPFMITLLIKALGRAKSDVALAAFVLLSALSGYLFVNPPTYLLFVLTLAVVAAVLLLRDRSPIAQRLRRPLFALCAIVAVNCYWLLPAYGTLFGTGHDKVSAQLDTTFLKFVDRRADIVNVLWLNPYWAWDFDMYFPFHAAYNNAGIIVSRFIPAALFFSALLNRKIHRRLVLLLVAAALGLMLLTTGMEPPFGVIGEFLYRHVPLYWLYREPTTKFPLVLIIVMAPLVGYQLSEIVRYLSSKAVVGAVVIRAVAAVGLLLALCLPAYPLITGQLEGVRNYDGIIADSNEIKIPQYWWDLSAYLHHSDPSARVLLLPNDDFYQMSYIWGLYAADQDVMSEILANPFVLVTNSSFSTYLTPSQNYVDFQNRFYQSVLSGTPGSIAKYTAAEGVRYIVERNDIDDSAWMRFTMKRADVARLMHASPELRLVKRFGLLDLYALRSNDYVPPVYVADGGGVENGKKTDVPRITRAEIRPAQIVSDTPTRLTVAVQNAKVGRTLVYAESYNPNWSACIVPDHGIGCGPPLAHKRAYGFENAWALPRSGRYYVRLSYGPQRQLQLGYAVSATAVLLSVVMLMALTRRATA